MAELKEQKRLLELSKKEVYDHAYIRKEARDRVPNVLEVFDKIMHFDGFEIRIRNDERTRLLAFLKESACEDFIIRKVEELYEPKLIPDKANPSISQIIEVGKIIFERAGDRPATAPPADDDQVFDYLQMDINVMPQMPN
jgi:hypothetical protein